MSADEPQDTRGTGDGKPSPLSKRRPPNPREQARRKANRAADNAEWKAMKANGRWS